MSCTNYNRTQSVTWKGKNGFSTDCKSGSFSPPDPLQDQSRNLLKGGG